MHHIKLIILLFSIFLCSFSAICKEGDLTIIDELSGKSFNITSYQFEHLPKAKIKTSTSWNPFSTFTGVKISEIIKLTGFNGVTLRFYAFNDYFVDIPMSDVTNYEIILATHIDGKKMTLRDFGPYFVIYPLDENYEELNKPIYLARFIWQVKEIKVLQK